MSNLIQECKLASIIICMFSILKGGITPETFHSNGKVHRVTASLKMLVSKSEIDDVAI